MRRTAVPLFRSLRRSSVFAIDTTTEEHCLLEDGQTVALIIFRNPCFFDNKSFTALPDRANTETLHFVRGRQLPRQRIYKTLRIPVLTPLGSRRSLFVWSSFTVEGSGPRLFGNGRSSLCVMAMRSVGQFQKNADPTATFLRASVRNPG